LADNITRSESTLTKVRIPLHGECD
jgi:hypothetical protein